MKAAEQLINALQAEGVEYVFALPGEENLDVLQALSQSSIQVITTRHEQGAGFMAATYARLTGRIGVCMCTLGPGATNMMTAVAFAQLGGMPLLVLTGQKPIKLRPQGDFQVIDVVDMMSQVTKYCAQISSADRVAALVRHACQLATGERPGAVHLELPEDIAADQTNEPLLPINHQHPSIASAASIAVCIDEIQQARRPLILIGADADRDSCVEPLAVLLDNTGIPFITTQMGKGVADEYRADYIGTAALSADDIIHRAIEHADLIINIGHDTVEKPPFLMQHTGQTVVHINHQPASIDEVYFPQRDVVGDIAFTLEQLAIQLKPQHHWQFDGFYQVKQAIAEHFEHSCAPRCLPVTPQVLVKQLAEHLPPESIVALDNGIYKLWFARNYPCRHPHSLLLDNALATMGAGLPAAMAAALVHPDRPVLAVCGDGGFLMNGQELETAVRLKLHITVLVLRDNAYGMIKWKQQHMGLRDFGLDYGNPDLVAMANSFAAVGHRPDSLEQLTDILQRCVEQPAVHVVDVAVDYRQNNQIFNHQLPRLSAQFTF